MNEGKIVEYIDQGKLVCTLCLQDKGNRLHLLTPLNRQVNLSPKRALLISRASLDPLKPREELLERLRETEHKRTQLMEQINVRELWDLIRDEKERFDHKYLAQLSFDGPITDDHLSALVRALFQDRLYFKLKDGRFLPNSEEKVEQIKTQRELEALQEERLKQGSQWLKTIQEGENPEAPPAKEEIVQWLVQLALFGNEAPDFKYGKELLLRSGISQIEEARNLLIKLGIWEEDENLDLIRSGIDETFSDEELEEAARLATFKVSFEGRADLRRLPVLTIDGPLTRDFDDAVSLEVANDSVHLGLHVADVASVVSPRSPMDQVAAGRVSSLYLPRRQISMIPKELSQEALSLKQGCDRPAISLFTRFDCSGKLLEYHFVPSVIQVKQQFTYDEVNGILDNHDILREMYRLSTHLRDNRLSQGALNLTRAELYVHFHEDSSFSVELIDQDTPSRMMVAEFMILYNWLAARFAAENRIPILYRTQAEPNERVNVVESNYLFFLFQQLRKLNPLKLDTAPGRHSGLGLDVYTQATSPLRRYLDLVIQRQIKSGLIGEKPVYTQMELEKIRMATEPSLKELERIKRNRMRYWILKFLGKHTDRTYSALVLDALKSKYRIVLPDFFLVAEIKKEDGVVLSPGKTIQVQIKRADPWDDVLELTYSRG